MAVSRDVEAAETQDPLLEYSVSSTHDVKLKWKILKYVDIFLSSTVLCFFIVACWTGTWTLLDIYGEYFPIYESFALSIFIHFVFAMCQKFFHNLLVEKPSKSVATKCVNWLLHKIYFLIFYISGIMNWRSGSIIFEDVFGITPDTTMYDFGVLLSTIATLVCCTILMWLGGMCNVTSAPMQVTVDCKSETFLFNYKFFRMGEKTSLYILDCLFSIVIVGTLVVFVWRGVWLLVDVFLFPDDYILSNWSSLVLGYLSVGLAFMLQPAMKYLCERLTGVSRLLVADIFILFALFGTVNVWRAIWNLLDIYFLPDNLELSGWITAWVSLIVLFLCRCSNSLLVRGVYIDAEEPGGDCAVFPCYYLRIIFLKKKLKKMNLNTYNLNDTIKFNQKEVEMQHNNPIVNINTISSSIEDSKDSKPAIV